MFYAANRLITQTTSPQDSIIKFNLSEERPSLPPSSHRFVGFTTSKVHRGKNVSNSIARNLSMPKLLIDRLIDALMININT